MEILCLLQLIIFLFLENLMLVQLLDLIAKLTKHLDLQNKALNTLICILLMELPQAHK